jgi:SEL1 protein
LNVPTSSTNGEVGITGDLTSGLASMKHAATYDDPDAIFLLTEMNFYGNFSHPKNFKEAFRWYSELVELDGNSTAQHMLDFMYATGIGDAVKETRQKHCSTTHLPRNRAMQELR